MRLASINFPLTNSAQRLLDRKCILAELVSPPTNTGTTTITENSNGNIVDVLAPGDSIRLDMKKSPNGSLNELKVVSSLVSGDTLIIRPIIKVEEGGT